MTSIKILLQIAANRSYHYRSVDITGAFLHSDIDREIYISVPDPDDISKRLVARLRKSIYGLKQSGKLWFDNLTSTLKRFGATACAHDECVFVYKADTDVMYAAIHVDDILIVSSRGETIKQLVAFLEEAYGEVTNSDASTHLGLKIDRDENGNITITQPGLIKKLLEELELTYDSRTEETPMTETYFRSIRRDSSSSDKADHTGRFQRLVGILIYLCHSRTDLLFASSVLSGRSNAPSSDDVKAVKRVGRYLLGTLQHGITFRADGPIEIHGYADASFANHSDGRSHSGNIISLVRGSAPVAAASKKQNIVALSSCEAELEALKTEATLTSWVLGLMAELGYEQTSPVVIHEDNNAAIALATKSNGNWTFRCQVSVREIEGRRSYYGASIHTYGATARRYFD
jgi:histone deacetylase 1/2